MAREQEFALKLLEWGKENRADFPWRGTADPYRVLVTELLLRKTTRKQVSKIYHKFFEKFPDAQSLANASEKSIEEAIRPLGMEHKRAALLKELGSGLASDFQGKVPSDMEQLLALPAVGPYAANAVLCFAFGQDRPLVDTNILRVVSRVFSVQSKKRRARSDEKIWRMVEELIPKGQAKEFNLSMLDFAASICLPKNPLCSICPILELCDYGKKRLGIT